ncbi:Metallo-dependent phosphatase-like protein [Dichomitus squalens]|uniref:Metallo-dependent phosphatase-like protein n=1 Tax=Dichomitus squalens TaxID=114155 RepID=A0A4Q9MLJ3_9APHY|nr:Metallo-dependent phosphatase-like protein [Dichomitus squalens]
MQFTSLLALFLAALAARACPGEEHGHAHEHQPLRRAFPQTRLPVPTRPLVWGDVNIIHTTDSHGWLLGHQKSSFPEPNYSGDLGDFASFVTHMKEIALEKDVDLLLVDSGDLHDGTGLSDGFPPGGVDGHETNKFIFDLPYDVMAIGNHELYIYANTLDMYKTFAPKLNGRYLSSNVNITVADKDGNPVSVPVGERFAKFKTRKGRKVTSLGVLFDFTGNDVNTTVQKVEDMVEEQWFAEAIKDEPDFFLLVGHMPVSHDHWPTVFDKVRAVHPTTPILILGGHTHIRDCIQLDGRSMALESGRYMETVGWMSVDLDHKGSNKNLTFTRRYLDPNRVSYEYHTGRGNFTFDTLQGKLFTQGLNNLAKRFNLSDEFGVAPEDYTISQVPATANNSLLSLFTTAMTYSLTVNNSRASVPNVMITNSGSMRFDVYAGAFTKNDQLTASPFADSFLYIPNVTLSIASQVLPTLNKAGANERRELAGIDLRSTEAYARGEVDMLYRAWLEEMDRKSFGPERRAANNATLGYVTHDSCPGVGDDIVHTPLPFFSAPDFIGSSAPAGVADSDPVDLVFVDFIESQLLEILNGIQSAKNYTEADVLPYTDVLASAVLGIYAEKFWN